MSIISIAAIVIIAIGLFIGLAGSAYYLLSDSDNINCIPMIFCLIGMVSLSIIGFHLMDKGNEIDNNKYVAEQQAIWNGGYHKKDGGSWELFDVAGTRSDIHYVYKCSKCGQTYTISGYWHDRVVGFD